MSHTCGSCDGSGECQNDHHNFLNNDLTNTIGDFVGIDNSCEACGEDVSRGNCSVCGGSGEQDD